MTFIKSSVLFVVLILVSIQLKAQQSNLIIFTQENEPFNIILNGIQQSPQPETNIKITGLTAPNYKLRVIFNDPAKPYIEKTIYLQSDVETTYEVLKNNKGVWVARMLNTAPIDEVPDQETNQHVWIYTATPRTSSTTTTVSQTTTVSAGSGFMGGGASASVTTTTTQTTTNADLHDDEFGEREDHQEYAGPKGCPRPMSTHAFDQALESISSKDFESSKLTIAKQVVSANCLRCNQVKQIMKLFTFESNKLDFAKYAYKYTWDIKNYFLLNDAFEFESSIDELNRFINKR